MTLILWGDDSLLGDLIDLKSAIFFRKIDEILEEMWGKNLGED